MKRYYIAEYSYTTTIGGTGSGIHGAKFEGMFKEEKVYKYFAKNANELVQDLHSFKLLSIHLYGTYEEMMEYNRLLSS